MEFSFPPPSHFLALPVEPPVPWTRWYETFETYISVLAVEDLSTARKRAMLIHCLGIEGQRIFKTLGAAADYTDCVRLLAGHFAAPQNVILQRILFRQHEQRAAQQIRHPPRSLSPVSLHDDSCGSSSHATRAQNCPARGQTCRRCGKQNHFARVCHSAPATSPRPASGQSTSPTTIHSIHSVRATPMPFKMCTVELDAVRVPFLLDTGAAVSLLNLSTIQRVFPQVTLTTPSAVLCGYGNARIELVGALSVAVRYGARTLPSFTFHVSRHGADLMGTDLFSALGFTLLDGAGAAILQVSSPWRQQWPTLFSGLGCLSAFNHQPLLNPDVRPVIQPLHRIPLALRDAVSEELQKLLQNGLIEPVNASPWISNLVIAKKKSEGLRVCVDLRAVNKAVIPNKYPLPTVEELTTQFYGATTFSKLDLRQGYLQVPLHPTAATSPPLSATPECIPGVVIYLDDIVVHGPTPALHDEHLHQVLSVLAKHNLTPNEEKYVYSVAAIEFVGFRLTAEGLSPLHSNVDAVQRLPEPTCPAQVASFLGMTAYYLRFLPQYSTTTAPLHELLKKDVPWVWTCACSTAIQQLKAQLTSPPVLAHFDFSSPTILTCDASNIAVGAVLSQLHRGTERPIAFASRALRHRPLRIHRWSERLQQYNFTPQFTPGRENVVADLLSRTTPCPPPSQDPDPEVTDLAKMLHTPLQTTFSLQDLQQASEQDPVLSQLRAFIRTGWPPKVPEELTPFYQVREELSCWGDVCVARGLRTVVPSCLRARILLMAHEGHLGIVKVKQRCRDLVWWPAIDRDIEAMVRDCTACLVSGKTGPPIPLQPLNWPDKPS
ncbi:hypothetical protein SKAU_G00209870 [Synaphobranchus kaupii]|uniref:Gypsy retrotransposon integrase-like protein 1 n=1 Tax=Synaphobranchus kaupii TaxID=118154 RepID=A0A9Q1F8U2_SYNKA|nr:hypothetical protein SKAU_G00209870 [Synaphobranchus kaupii]